MAGHKSYRLIGAECRTLINAVVCIWVVAAAFAVKPGAADAAKKRALKSEPVKGKAAPAPQRPTVTPAKKTLLKEITPPADPMEIRDHVVHRVQPGESLLAILNRFRLPFPEKQLWTRTVKRDIGPEALRPG